MTNYEQMSNLEINKRVAEHLCTGIDSDFDRMFDRSLMASVERERL